MRSSLVRCAVRQSAASKPAASTIWSDTTGLKALDKTRSEVVNPELCQYALKVLRASLPAPETCDIIDLNPGPAIWSKALNDAVKPRRHILVELDQERFLNNLKPLLRKPSAYRLTDDISLALDTTKDLLSPELRKASNSSQERNSRRPTDQLIITGTLSPKKVSSSSFHGSTSKYLINQYYKAIFYGTSSLAFGPLGIPKLLLWVPDRVKLSFLPRTTVYRTRSSLCLEASCDVREIVGSFYNDSVQSQRQTKHINIVAQLSAVAKLPSILPDLPADRLQPTPTPPYNGIQMNLDTIARYQALKTKPQLIQHFLSLHKEMAKEIPEAELLTAHYKRLQKSHPRITEYLTLRSRLMGLYYAYERVEKLARDQIRLEKSYVDAALKDPSTASAFFDSLRPEFAALDASLSPRLEDTKHAVKKSIDDFRVLLSSPPALSFNNRLHEPIRCHDSDFSQQNTKMCLLEITPKQSFHNILDTESKVLCFEFVVDCFMVKSSGSLERSLQQLLVMTSDNEEFMEFVKGVSSLNDPTKGIVNELGKLRARSLPVGTWIDVALAYHDWPLRKTDEVIRQWLNAAKENIGGLEMGRK